jgi:hypothetical protein
MSKYFKYFFLIVVPVLALIIAISHYLVQPPIFNSEEELLNFAENKQDKQSACLSYIKLLKIDSTNSKYHLLLAQEWHNIEKKRIEFLSIQP